MGIIVIPNWPTQPYYSTADLPKMPIKKPDFYVSQMSEKSTKSSIIDMSRFRKNIETNG